ncbi:hypothetical protein [Saccharibacillus qingshengii]|uniref:hypothetical protein n=1 Tax=Saccharibacillus qingshengii TaxID=1763540 RepID=UPI0015543707|nr:hypothetical protein [Saccharibacillus qingshengii]
MSCKRSIFVGRVQISCRSRPALRIWVLLPLDASWFRTLRIHGQKENPLKKRLFLLFSVYFFFCKRSTGIQMEKGFFYIRLTKGRYTDKEQLGKRGSFATRRRFAA